MHAIIWPDCYFQDSTNQPNIAKAHAKNYLSKDVAEMRGFKCQITLIHHQFILF